jgi:imidazolonepropionase-like amidohydrolase
MRRIPRLVRGAAWIVAVPAVGLAALWIALAPPAVEVPERGDLLLRDVTVVEPGRARRPHQDLRIRQGQIEVIEPTAGFPSRDSGFEGLYALPGLIDMHVHYPPWIARGNQELWSLLFLAHGVTSVRETGSIDGSSLRHRAGPRGARRPGPRLFTCGSMLDGDPPSFPSNRLARSPSEGRRAVADLAAAGVDCIKVYNMLSRPAFEAIRDEARARGLPLIGHKPHAVSFESAGIDDLQHFTGAVRVDLEKVGRMDFRLEDWETVDGDRIAYVIKVARDQHLAFTPTLVNARQRLRNLDPRGPEADESDTGLSHLPSFWWTAWRVIWGPAHGPGEWPLYQRFRDRLAEISAAAWRVGIAVNPGTDTLMPFVAPGSSLWGELEEMESAGIPLEQVWAAATSGAGEALGVPGLGRLEPGAPADLLLFREDPSRDLRARSTLQAVIADGRLYRRADLDRALARSDAHFRGPLYETTMGGLVRLAAWAFAP